MSTKPIKILLICQMFYPELISTGKSMTELCEALSEDAVDIEVWCGPMTLVDRKSSCPSKLNYKGMTIRRLHSFRFSKLSFLGKLLNHLSFAFSVALKLLFSRPKRLIFVLTNPPFLAVVPAFFRFFGGAKFVYKIADMYPETAIALDVLGKNSLLSIIWRRCNRFIYNQASAIVVLGRCMEAKVRAQLPNGVEQKLYSSHVWGDDSHIFEAGEQRDFRQIWGIDKSAYVLLYSGNMGRFHDMETIMAAAHALRDQTDIVFLFVGEGYKKQFCLDYVDAHKLQNCLFKPYVSREDFPSLLGASDVGLVSLLAGQEGYSVPSKTFSLMAAGLPILGVLPAASEISLMIAEEHCGVVVEPGDVSAMVGAVDQLRNREDRAALSKQAVRAVRERYNVKKVARDYRGIFESVTGS